VLVGGAVLRISIGTTYLNYVKEGMRPYLIASGVLLLLLGVLALLDAIRQWRHRDVEPVADVDDDGHDGGHGAHGRGGPKAAWLLLLPVLAIFLIAPPALGAYTAARDTTNAAPPAQPKAPPLPAGDPVEVYVSDYVSRAVWDDGLTLADRVVQMTGFVTPDPAGGWWLTRLTLTCCAADAVTSKVKAIDVVDFPANTWVTVTGQWIAGGGTNTTSAIPLLQVQTLTPVAQPENPYE
jgi:uncharacterized repeat protein (TIGR03943 family)